MKIYKNLHTKHNNYFVHIGTHRGHTYFGTAYGYRVTDSTGKWTIEPVKYQGDILLTDPDIPVVGEVPDLDQLLIDMVLKAVGKGDATMEGGVTCNAED